MIFVCVWSWGRWSPCSRCSWLPTASATRGRARAIPFSRCPLASEFCPRHGKKARPTHLPIKKKGGRAPKGASSKPHQRMRRAPRERTLPSTRASGALAFRRPTAALATQINAVAQSRPCFLGRATCGRYPPRAVPVQRSTPQAGRYAGQSDARTARGWVTSPPAGTAPAPSIGCHRSTSLRWASFAAGN